MKEIKAFMEMMESRAAKRDIFGICCGSVMDSCQYKALKAILDKPIPKMEITDDMVKLALGKFYTEIPLDIPEMQPTRQAMKSALQAVFDHIGDVANMVEPVSANTEQATDTQPNEGWIEWGNYDPEYSPDLLSTTLIEVKYGGGRRLKGELGAFIWGWMYDNGFGDKIAYRIMPEAKATKESVMIDPKEYHIHGSPAGNTKKQTLLEYACDSVLHGNLDALTISEAFDLMSEYLEQSK